MGSILSTTQDREFYSLQAGVTKVYGVFVLSGSVGPSYNRFVDYTITSGAFLYSSYVVQPPVYNAGVAFKVQAILCAQFAGFGFSFDGNFNGKSSFIGGTLSVSLGWMRRSRFIDLPLKHGG